MATTEGEQLPAIQTELLAFLPLAGNAKLQLTPTWSPPPAPTASLLAIASRRAIVAAAGPDAIYISSTESVRKGFQGPKNDGSEIRPFEGQVTIPMTLRISHLAFTPDEQYLIMSAQQGGGLAVYETQTLLQGSSPPAFEISTSGEAIKTLAPNPMSELSEFCAVVTTNGNLLMANLKDKNLSQGASGPVLRNGVTSVGWSTKGKQLVAGLADGSIIQMTPDGTEKAAIIPKPPPLGNFQVASISWLENHVFLAIYNDSTDVTAESAYYVINRSAPAKQTPSFEYRKLIDPIPAFGNELPPYHTVLRLKEYPPAVQELLILTSSASDELGLLTKARTSLATQDFAADEVINIFTTTEFTDDIRRAQLPPDEGFNSTTPTGIALDLSSKDKVWKPIPDNLDIEYSSGPLPGAWALNNQGVLSVWWVVYYDAVKEGQTYQGLAALQDGDEAQPATSAPPKSSAFGTQPSFATPAFANPSPAPSGPFAAAPAAANSGPSFGQPAFGAASNLGIKPPAPAFGQHGGLGARSSPWATGTAGSAGAAPAFGKVFGSGVAPAASTGGSAFTSLAGQSGFAGLASNSGGDSVFSKPASSSPFGATPGGQSAFGGGGSSGVFGNATAFGSSQTPSNSGSLFAAPGTSAQTTSAFGSSPFVLGTTFKADPVTANDNDTPSSKGGFSLGGFSMSLDGAGKPTQPTDAKDITMDAETPTEHEKPKSVFDPRGSTTPTATPASSKLFSSGESKSFGVPASSSSIFGAAKPSTEAPKYNPFAPAEAPKVNPFAQAVPKVNPFARSESPKANPFAQNDNKPKSSPSQYGALFGGSSGKLSDADSAVDPLPPNTTSKAAYPYGESSSSSIASAKAIEDSQKPSETAEDAPLPPDFVAPKSKKSDDMAPPPLPKEDSPIPEEAPLPPDFTANPKTETKSSFFDAPAAPLNSESSNDDLSEDIDSDDEDGENEQDDLDGDSEEGEQEGGSEGSGIDVAKDLSPRSAGTSHTPGQTPQSSFGGMGGSTYSLVSRPDVAQPPRPSMFGSSAPIFSKPSLSSPRSPSPVRSALPSRMFPGEGSRSVSAPSVAARPHIATYSKSVNSSRVLPKENPNVALQREAQKKQAQQEEQSLEDDEFEHVQADLERPLVPTLELGEFDPYLSVTADAHASTVAAQVEALYRDMNGMLLALGTNARTIGSFILGHEQHPSNEPKMKEDLGKADDWVLCEAEDLERILDDELMPELEDARVQDVQDTWDTCQDLVRELPKLRAKKADLKRILDTIFDPEQADAARNAPLSAEQTAQRNALRHGYARVAKLMADAESALTMLKTKLTTLSGTPSAQPTVEAIIRTIARMTSAAEKRSGDIDILELQMRKLRVAGSLPPSASRESTPEVLRTPTPTKRSSLSRTMSGASPFSPSPMRSQNGSASRSGPSPRKKISGYTEEDKDAIRQKMEKRQAVLDRLRGKLVENGAKISRMGDAR